MTPDFKNKLNNNSKSPCISPNTTTRPVSLGNVKTPFVFDS